jgi:hypothetical protein
MALEQKWEVQDFEKQVNGIGNAVPSPPCEWPKTALLESIARTVNIKVPLF